MEKTPFKNYKQYHMPIVPARIKLGGNKIAQAYFLLDTGSEGNRLSSSLLEHLDETTLVPGKESKTVALGDTLSGCIHKCRFKVGEQVFEEEFSVTESFDCSGYLDGVYLLGILGTRFFYNNKLVLDYEELCLRNHTTLMVEEGMKNIGFAMDMMFGLENWNLPVVAVSNGNNNYYCMIVDSGNDKNSITLKCIQEGRFPGKDNEGLYNVWGCGWEHSSVKSKNIEMYLLGMTLEDGILAEIPVKLDFFVFPDVEYFIKSGENAEHIHGLLGNDFLYRNKVIIDYGNRCIYNFKHAA